MAKKLLSVCFAGLVAVGGVFWLSGQSSWAWEPAVNPQYAPISANSVAPSPAYGQQSDALPNGAAPDNLTPQAAEPPAELQPQAETATDEYDEPCEDFCGLSLCSPPGRFWLRADYLIWWTNGVRLPPLVTTSPNGTPVDEAGVLGNANTSILYGDNTALRDGRSGFHTTIGMWLDCCHQWDLEFDYLSLGQYGNSFSESYDDRSILARPFFNVQSNAQASQLVTYPGEVEGTVTANVKDYFDSVGVSLSYNLCSCDDCCDDCCDPCEDLCGPPLLFCCRTDLLVGFRNYNLRDSLTMTEDLRVTEDGPTQDTTYVIHDNFKATNHFYGSELGLRTKLYRGRWSLQILTKIAIGNTHQTVTIDGTTAITAPGESTRTYNAGILAGYTNSGKYQADSLTLIPQLGLELGYQVNQNLRAYLGYNLLYWSAIARAADQIDLNLDPRNFPPATPGGLPFPAFPGDVSSFWAQGINVGGEVRF